MHIYIGTQILDTQKQSPAIRHKKQSNTVTHTNKVTQINTKNRAHKNNDIKLDT